MRLPGPQPTMHGQLLNKCNINLRASACMLGSRPPPVRSVCNTERAVSECSTSYEPNWPRFKRGSFVRVAATRGGSSNSGRRRAKAPPPPPPPEDEEEEETEELTVPASYEENARRLLSRRAASGAAAVDHPPAATPPSSATASTPAYGDFAGADIRDIAEARTNFFHSFFELPETTWRDIPLNLLPRDKEDERKYNNMVRLMAYMKREWDGEAMDDTAFYLQEKSKPKTHNIYANVAKIAAYMRELEKEDFALGEKQTYFSSWTRAEILFAQDFDEFNDHIKQNIDSIVRQPLEEELRERLEAIGEATLLPPTESEQLEPKFPSTSEVAMLMDQYFLEGVLPGVSLAAPLDSYADDIYGGNTGESVDEIFSMAEAQEDADEAA